MKFLNFFLFLWVIFALLDPDPDSESGSGSKSISQFSSTVEVKDQSRKKNIHLAEIFRVSDSWLCSFLTLARVVDPH
jgi:hypothetical protein